MALLIAGVVLWSLVHLVPALLPAVKKRWINMVGNNGYQATFSILIVLSLVMIVYGWRHAIPEHIYTLPAVANQLAMVLMVIAFLLFGAAIVPSRINSYIRHPQLLSVLIWSFAHLLVNGDSRSIILFSGMGVWAVLEIIFINRREGVWTKPARPGLRKEALSIAVSLAFLVVAVLAHPYIAGVAIR